MDNMENDAVDLDQDYLDEGFDAELEQEPSLEDLGLTPEEQKLFARIQEKLKYTDPVLKALAEMKSPPSEELINSLKEQTGDEVYFITLSEKENFLFRPIRRQEWRTLMEQTAKLNSFKRDEALVAKAILYPKIGPSAMGALNAGTIETLKEMILRASNFMTPEQAIQSTRKL